MRRFARSPFPVLAGSLAVGFIADGCSRSECGKEQVVQGLTLTLQDSGEDRHVLGNEQRVGAHASFPQPGIDHSLADRLKCLRLDELRINLLVDLVFEVAQFFDALVFHSDETDGLWSG